MKKIMQSILALLFITVFVACGGNPFVGSAFGTIDAYEPPDLTDATADDIVSEGASDGFLDSLDEMEDTEVENIITTLDESIAEVDPATATTQDQAAALLLADVYMASTGVDDTLNNVSSLITGFLDGGGEDPDGGDGGDSGSEDDGGFETIVTDLFAFDDTATEEEQTSAVEDQLLGLLGAADALEFYGDSTATLGENPEADADVASTALMAGVVSFMIDNVEADDSGDGETSEEEAAAAVAEAIVTGNFDGLTFDEGAFPEDDPDTLEDESGMANVLATMLGGEDSGLYTLADSGGVLDLASMFE